MHFAICKCQVTALMGHHTILSPLLFQPSLISQSLLLYCGLMQVRQLCGYLCKASKGPLKVWKTDGKFEQANISVIGLAHCTIVHWIGTSSSRHFEVYGLAVLIQPRNKFALPTPLVHVLLVHRTHFRDIDFSILQCAVLITVIVY